MKKTLITVLVACMAAMMLSIVPASAKAAYVTSSDEVTVMADEPTWNVCLKEVGVNKVKVVKILRTYLDVDLKVAYELAQKTPVVVKEEMPEKDAKAFEKELIEAGATVELQKPGPKAK